MYSHMHSLSRTVIRSVIWIGAGMIFIVVFHIGGGIAHTIGQFSPLTGAIIGGSLALFSAAAPRSKNERTEPWIGLEQLSWLLIGFGVIMWAAGEAFWRYYMAKGQAPFPSTADIGYSSFPPLAFIGLLLLPSSGVKSRRVILLMDSLIAMGSIFALAWYLLLGSLAQAPGEANLAKFLGMYYPVGDTALLSCVVFLLLRGQSGAYQARARRISLLVIGLGLCFFVGSDFIFNIQQNAGTYVEATWIDLGWPLGMMMIGLAAYLRRFLPATPVSEASTAKQRIEQQVEKLTLGPMAFAPYCLLGLLFVALAFNVLSTDPAQVALRTILLCATLGVVALVIVRQVYTLRENGILAQQQAEALENLEHANRRIEEQARQIMEHNVELESGIAHLQEVQARLANGNLQARAHLTKGVLISLAGSLNIMAERLMRLGEAQLYAKRLTKALNDLSMVFERAASTGSRVAIPESCSDLVEIHRLLVAMGMKRSYPVSPSMAGQPLPTTSPHRPVVQPVTPPPQTPSPRAPFTGGRPSGQLVSRVYEPAETQAQPNGARPPRTVQLTQREATFPFTQTEPLGGTERK